MWGVAQNNLGCAYRDRIRGDRAQNLEQAIACYQRALQVRTPETVPTDWAMTEWHLVKRDRQPSSLPCLTFTLP
ncbi:tetratricopeptide repeat protein [Microcoleus sp. AS-A8]